MGGWGSGRQFGKATADDQTQLDVRYLQRHGILKPDVDVDMTWNRRGKVTAAIKVQAEAGRVTLSYNVQERGGEWERMNYAVHLEWTACNLGGQRAWFICPACGRRVAILYAGHTFTCRHCLNLAYQCQREPAHDRARLRAERIRARLGWKPGIANPEGGKPKGMHWKTFERLTAEHEAFSMTSFVGAARMLKLKIPGLG